MLSAGGAEVYWLTSPRIVVGRDNRPSSPDLADALIAGVRAGGVDVLDIGTVPTPMVWWAEKVEGLDGAIQITGSHNPPEWNGIKMTMAGGSVFGDAMLSELTERAAVVRPSAFTRARGVPEARTEVARDRAYYIDLVRREAARQIKTLSRRECIERALAKGGTYRAVGGKVAVLLSLVFGGQLFRLQGKSVGMLLVPSGRELTSRVAQLVVEGAMEPHLEDVLPLSAVPEALGRTGRGEVKGKLVIRP